MALKLVAVAGSPVKGGNLDAFVDAIAAMAAKKGLESETIRLAELQIADCIHCNFCLSKQQPGKYCALKDDAQPIFEALEGADIVLLASPVYFMRTSGQMASFIDRLRIFIFGNLAKNRLRNKIGMSAAVAWLRHGGLETAHLSHLYAFMTLEMIPATAHGCISPLGASAMASEHGEGKFDPAVRLGVEIDRAGLRSARALLTRAIELAELTRR
jgi:multimeric flavodoxin WrbA